MTNKIAINNDPVLQRIFRGYMPPESDFIRSQVLPVIPVQSEAGDIKLMGNEGLRIHNTVVVGRSGTPEITTSITKAAGWKTERHALKIAVEKEDGKKFNVNNWQEGMTQAREMYTRVLKRADLIAKEKALADALFSTSNISQNTTLTGNAQFNSPGSDPIAAIETGKTAIWNAAGVEANTLIMSRPVFRALINNPNVKKTVGTAVDGTVPIKFLTIEQLKVAFDVQNIIVGKVKYNSAKEGQTDVLADVWGKHLLVAYINPNPTPDMIEKSLGFTFELTPVEVDYYKNEDSKYGEFVRTEEEYDDVILDATAAYLIYNAVA